MNYLILVGGQGKRLRKAVQDLPKPLAPIGKKPFLDLFFKHIGFKPSDTIYLLCHYKLSAFEDYKMRTNYNVEIIEENHALGTGGAVKNAFELLDIESALVFNGDCIQNLNLSALEYKINENSPLPHIVVREVDDVTRYGQVIVKNNYILGFKEKNKNSKGLINSGIYYLTKKEIDLLPCGNSSLEKDLFERYCNKINFKAYTETGYFIDIGVPEDYLKAVELYS